MQVNVILNNIHLGVLIPAASLLTPNLARYLRLIFPHFEQWLDRLSISHFNQDFLHQILKCLGKNDVLSNSIECVPTRMILRE